jgi:Leucine-rich repeat (LRR) protein
MKVFDKNLHGKIIKTIRFEKETVGSPNIDNPEEIERLEIAFCNLTNLPDLACLKKLRQISIYYCRSLGDLSQISSLSNLETIDLYSLPKVEILFDVSELTKLRALSYTYVKKIHSIKGIEELPNPIYLGLSKVKVTDNDYSPII